MKVVYCTIAIGKEYRKISLKLLTSFLHNTTDSVLHIFTDYVDYYTPYNDVPNLVVDKIHLNKKKLPNFDLNCKSLMLDFSYLQYPDAEIIVLCDCDMFIKEPVDNTWFDTLKPGINMVMGEQGETRPLSYFQNQSIYEKGLVLSGTAESQWYLFREGLLIMAIKGMQQEFLSFTQEWEKIYAEVTNKGLVDVAQILEINLASERSNFPLNNMSANPLQGCYFYEERNGSLNQSLR